MEQLRRAIGIRPAVADWTLERLSPTTLTLRGDFRSDMVYTFEVAGALTIRDGFGLPLQPSSVTKVPSHAGRISGEGGDATCVFFFF